MVRSSLGLAESQRAARTDMVTLLVLLLLSQEGQEPQGAARAPELSIAWGVYSSALGSSPGSWRAGVTTAVAPPGKGG